MGVVLLMHPMEIEKSGYHSTNRRKKIPEVIKGGLRRNLKKALGRGATMEP
jgi:hypothetical protein